MVLVKLTTTDDGTPISAFVDFLIHMTTVPELTLTAMHIHRGVAGQNGPVVIDSRFGDRLTAQGDVRIWRQNRFDAAAQLQSLRDIAANPDGFYVNIHSTGNPAGIIRGQLIPMEVSAIRMLDRKVNALNDSVAEMRRLIEALAVRAGILAPTR